MPNRKYLVKHRIIDTFYIVQISHSGIKALLSKHIIVTFPLSDYWFQKDDKPKLGMESECNLGQEVTLDDCASRHY